MAFRILGRPNLTIFSVFLESCQQIFGAAVKDLDITLFVVIIERRHAHVKPLRYPADGCVDIELAHKLKI